MKDKEGQEQKTAEGVTLWKCMDQVAKDNGWDKWEDIQGRSKHAEGILWSMAAELYASQKLEEYRRLSSKEDQGWVSVKDEWPLETTPVLWCRMPVEEPYEVASMCDEGFDETYWTHWRPLPPSPIS